MDATNNFGPNHTKDEEYTGYEDLIKMLSLNIKPYEKFIEVGEEVTVDNSNPGDLLMRIIAPHLKMIAPNLGIEMLGFAVVMNKTGPLNGGSGSLLICDGLRPYYSDDDELKSDHFRQVTNKDEVMQILKQRMLEAV